MATNYNPKMVLDGLEILLDVSNLKSYPGSGTTWNDISKTGEIFTQDGSAPDYVSGPPAYLDFEASSAPGDSLRSSGSLSTHSAMRYSRCAWFTIESDSAFRSIIGNSIGNNIDMSLATDNYKLTYAHYHTDGGEYRNNGNTIMSANTWYYGVITVDRYTNKVNFYINGEVDRENVTINEALNATSNTIMIGGADSDSYSGARMFDGKIGMVAHYNRILSIDEVKQNFEATRGRYGL